MCRDRFYQNVTNVYLWLVGVQLILITLIFIFTHFTLSKLPGRNIESFENTESVSHSVMSDFL